MPPPSPDPGWASGEVCRDRTASERTADDKANGTYPAFEKPVLGCLGAGGRCFLAFDGGCGVGGRPCSRLEPLVGDVGALQAFVLVLEGEVHLDEGLLLGLGNGGVAQDLAGQVVLALALFEDAGAHI